MDIFDNAKQLGMMIAKSDKMERLQKAENALENDVEASEMMETYKQRQIDVVRATKMGLAKEEVDAFKLKLLEHQQALNKNAVTKEYLDSKVSFDKFIKDVNQVIMFAITGEEGCSPSKCGSCSGCGTK